MGSVKILVYSWIIFGDVDLSFTGFFSVISDEADNYKNWACFRHCSTTVASVLFAVAGKRSIPRVV